jgi:hypothetical protein
MHVSDPAARAAVVRRMTAGQRMLLAHAILAGHSGRGLADFCAEMPHQLVHDRFWALLDAGLRLVEDDPLLALIRRLRREVGNVLAEAGCPAEPGRDGALDPDGFVRVVEALERVDRGVMADLDERYRSLAPASLWRVAGHIRAHAAEFVLVGA